MGWATSHIVKLKDGETVQFCAPNGKSMMGRIESGQLVTVEPISDDIKIDEIVLCSVHGRQYLHLVKGKRGDQYQIGNNHGSINGWTNAIYGRVTAVQETSRNDD
jgi:hypothetical protein